MAYILEKEVLQKYVFIALVVLLFTIAYFIVKPYLVVLLSAFVLAFLLKPVHRFFGKKIGDRSAAGVCMLLFILIVILPMGVVFGMLANEAYSYANKDTFEQTVNAVLGKAGVELNPEILDRINTEVLNFIIRLVTPMLSNALSFFVKIAIMFFALYFVLVKWDGLASELEKFVPFKDKKKKVRELSSVTKEIVFGTLLLGAIEFVVAYAGFYILGVKGALLLASLIFFAAFIPGLGPSVVWAPLAIYFGVIGNYFGLIGAVILGAVLSFGMDLLLRAVMVGRKNKINPLIMLLGVLGGISLFGIFGFVIGPLILIYAIKFLEGIFVD